MVQQINFLLYSSAFLAVLAVAAYNFLYLRQVKNIRSKLGMFVPRPIYFALWFGIWFPIAASWLFAVLILISVFA